jgi:SAM-dependent methyltransferase
MSKYEYAADAGITTPSDQARFKEIVDLVSPYLDKDQRLLDVGCATGGLLAEFKSRGYNRLLGTDPSPSCARLASRLHGIDAKAVSIAQLGMIEGAFDAVFLTGVLEHVRDVDGSLRQVGECVAGNGLLYIEVPDASRYHQHFSAPYQLLSMEHINYFSPSSLGNLLNRHGFAPIFNIRLLRDLSPQAIEPCVGALFRKSRKNLPKQQADKESMPSLERYLAGSAEVERTLHARIEELAESNTPIVVWGAGTHTLRLLKTSRLRDARIIAFIDSNPNYQGKNLEGIAILPPSSLVEMPAVDILISSQVAETAIHETITKQLGLTNRVHRLYAG